MENNTNAQQAENCKVSIKIPPFWTDKPEIWFFQIEAQFEINSITSENTKFNYLVSQLEPKYVENIWDIVTDRTATTKYSLAKTRLLDVFKESESKRIKRLVTGIELGDLKPSQLLQKMKNIATDDVSDKILKTLFLDKMPDSIKHILLVSEESLEKLAIMADKIVEMNVKPEIYSTNEKSDTMSHILKKISLLENQVARLNIHRQSRSDNRSFDSPRHRSRSRSQNRKYNPNGKLCFYHFKFGAKCIPEKCKQPCSWISKESEN